VLPFFIGGQVIFPAVHSEFGPADPVGVAADRRPVVAGGLYVFIQGIEAKLHIPGDSLAVLHQQGLDNAAVGIKGHRQAVFVFQSILGDGFSVYRARSFL